MKWTLSLASRFANRSYFQNIVLIYRPCWPTQFWFDACWHSLSGHQDIISLPWVQYEVPALISSLRVSIHQCLGDSDDSSGLPVHRTHWPSVALWQAVTDRDYLELDLIRRLSTHVLNIFHYAKANKNKVICRILPQIVLNGSGSLEHSVAQFREKSNKPFKYSDCWFSYI